MMTTARAALLLATAFALAACGGGGGSAPAPSAAVQAPVTQPTANAADLVTPKFTLFIPAAAGSTAGRRAQFVSSGANSVTISLNTVNGGAPPGGLTTSVSTNITPGACSSGCTVNGPASPPGTDNYSVSTFTGASGAGTLLGTASQSFVLVAGSANSNLAITLNGIPASFSISAPTAVTANTTPAAQTLTIAVLDGSGATILGAYTQSVTLTDSDASGVQGTQLSLTPGTGSASTAASGVTSVVITNSDDVVQVAYGGLAIASPTLHASASGATAANATFTVNLNAITSSVSEIDLYSPLGSGTGSTFPVTFAELGFSNSPYNKTFTATTPVACINFATFSGSPGTVFTATAIASPIAGTCAATAADGLGQTNAVTLTYTTSSFGVK